MLLIPLHIEKFVNENRFLVVSFLSIYFKTSMMSNSLNQLLLYNNWANQLLFEAFKGQPDAIPLKCLHLLNHLTNAQAIWTSRLTGEVPGVDVWGNYSLADCERHHIQSSTALTQLLADHKGGELVNVSYTNTKNEHFTNTRIDILLHIFNHGTYHRAQIATEMRKNGLEPINTDYITFARSIEI